MRKIKSLLLFLLLCFAVQAENPYRSYNNFNAGELYLLSNREDLAKYQSGCSIMENLIPLPQGGAEKRPGTKYIAEVKTSSQVTRIIPFEYSTEQSYIVEVGNQYMRFFTDGAAVYETYGTEDLSSIGSIVAHWKCDDNAADKVVVDADGATHNGATQANTSALTVANEEGTANSALDLGDADYITVGDHGDFTFGNGSTDTAFSISAWVYYTSDGADQVIISKHTTAGNEREWHLSVLGPEETVFFYIFDASATSAQQVTTRNALTSGNWYFIVATYDGRGGANAADGLNIYVNWLLQEVARGKAATYVSMEDKAADVIVGAKEVSQELWVGTVDNVAVFSKALTVIEVASLTGSNSTTVYEIATPYLTADLFELKFKQSADVLYIAHPDYETRKLSRLANAVWPLEVFDCETGPFRSQNDDTNAKIAADGTTGEVTLTATGCAPFIAGTTAGHLPSGYVATSKSSTGALFKLIHPLDTLEYTLLCTDSYDDDTTEGVSWLHCGTLYKGAGWTLVTDGTWSGTLEIQRNYTIGAAHDADGWETVLPYTSPLAANQRNVSTSGTEDDGDADYRAILVSATTDACLIIFATDQTEIQGIVEITAVASTTSATGTVIRTLGSTDATHKWSEGSWSNYRGWPQTASFFEDRLCFGGNTTQPDTIWGSVTGDYENFTEGAEDDDAINFTLSSRQVNVIEWLIGKDKLLIGTSGAEWSIAGGTDEPLTPSNVLAKQHSTYGSANIQATLANESALFFQRGKEKIRELAYNWESDSYVAPDMTLLANFVTEGGIVDTGFQRTPNSILWCVRNDGELPVFSYERAENVTAWSRMLLGGTFIHGLSDLGLATDLVAHWKLDEDAASTAVDNAEGTAALDGTASANTSTLSAEGAATVSGTSFDFGGTAYVTISDHGDFSFGDGTDDSPFSISAWIYVTITGTAQAILVKATDSATGEWSLVLDASEKVILRIIDNSVPAGVSMATDAALSVGWHHIVATYDGTGGATAHTGMAIYVDNVLVAQTGATNDGVYVAMEAGTLDVNIGAESDFGIIFQDKLDSIMIFDVELSSSDVTLLYDADFSSQNFGEVESIAVINGDPEDEVWSIVGREIDGSVVRYIEQFQPRAFGDAEDAFYVDCGVTYDLTPSSAMTGLTHLVGETVSVLADSVVFDDAVVSGTGTITLKLGGTTTTASTVQMGLPYEVHLRTMPLSWVAQGQTIQGRMKRISEVIPSWYKSGDFSVGRDIDTLGTHSITGQTTDMDSMTFPAGFDRNGYVYVYQKSPEPLTLLALMVEFHVE